MMISLDPELLPYFSNRKPLFDQLMGLRGEVFRSHKNRRTMQIQLGDNTYFIKQHHAMGWREIFRHIKAGQFPILDARIEYKAIRHLNFLNIPAPKVVGFGWRGTNPAKRESFLITAALPAYMNLESLLPLKSFFNPSFKQQLISAVGKLAGRLHQSGFNHRDFYLCHLLLLQKELSLKKDCTPPPIHVIDLHRAGLRERIPLRWRLKDLAALDFSSRDGELTQQDKRRFQKAYEAAIEKELPPSFWKMVKKRGDRLYDKYSK